MPRRSQLVCQHLENISRDALQKYQAIIRRYVRHRQGIYALYRRNKLYYVGLAGSLQSRLAMHLRDHHAHSWDRFSVYLTIGDSHLRELESLILRVVKPSGNKQKGKFARSEDLRRKLTHDFRSSFTAEIDEMFGKPARRSLSRVPPPRTPVLDTGRTPVLAAFVSTPLILRARHKGHKLTARVRRNGTILFAGHVYTSPSVAGAAAVKRKSCNGWTFWEYERAPGDWITIDALRRN
ncbi:MAG: hypothetical protein WCS01_17280 [bacterium]